MNNYEKVKNLTIDKMAEFLVNIIFWHGGGAAEQLSLEELQERDLKEIKDWLKSNEDIYYL